MNVQKEEKLNLLNKELKYLETEYLEKMSHNKQHSLNQVFEEFKGLFRQNDCDFLIDLPSEIKVKKGMNICQLKPSFDFKEQPKSNRQFDLSVENLKEGVWKATIRLFIDENRSNLDQPDLNRLKTNPYEGMDSVDIEIYERQKSVDYMKKYITEFESYHWNFLCLDHASSDQKLYDTVENLHNEKVHNKLYEIMADE